jgi:HD-like signal output (HDOD) protein
MEIKMPITEQLKDRIRHMANLPTLPQVASYLMQTVNDPHTSINDVALVVAQDLSLSAKILRLANSAFYGIPRTITNINNAVIILGLKVINTMVLSLTVFDMFNDNPKSTSLFDRKSFWLHSLCCGLIAKFLTLKIRKFILFDPEEAFCAGLLHDIGKVVMEQYLHEDFHVALKYAKQNKLPVVEAEEKILGYTHNDVAEWLTTSWGLPSEILMPIIYHHNPDKAPECEDIVSLCHISDQLCYKTQIVKQNNYELPRLDKASMESLKLTDMDIEEIMAQIPSEMPKISIFLEV